MSKQVKYRHISQRNSKWVHLQKVKYGPKDFALHANTLYFFSIYSKMFSYSIKQLRVPTCARTFPISVCIEHIESKAPGSRCTTCRHFWMQAEGQTSRRWCTWGGYWWQEFSITVRSEVRAGTCKVLDEEMKERMRQWILDKRRQKLRCTL